MDRLLEEEGTINVSKEERAQLMAFLKSLTPEPKPSDKPQVP
jgi:hypothetical protein